MSKWSLITFTPPLPSHPMIIHLRNQCHFLFSETSLDSRLLNEIINFPLFKGICFITVFFIRLYWCHRICFLYLEDTIFSNIPTQRQIRYVRSRHPWGGERKTINTHHFWFSSLHHRKNKEKEKTQTQTVNTHFLFCSIHHHNLFKNCSQCWELKQYKDETWHNHLYDKTS